jgi:hypothetical protein
MQARHATRAEASASEVRKRGSRPTEKERAMGGLHAKQGKEQVAKQRAADKAARVPSPEELVAKQRAVDKAEKRILIASPGLRV